MSSFQQKKVAKRNWRISFTWSYCKIVQLFLSFEIDVLLFFSEHGNGFRPISRICRVLNSGCLGVYVLKFLNPYIPILRNGRQMRDVPLIHSILLTSCASVMSLDSVNATTSENIQFIQSAVLSFSFLHRSFIITWLHRPNTGLSFSGIRWTSQYIYCLPGRRKYAQNTVNACRGVYTFAAIVQTNFESSNWL